MHTTVATSPEQALAERIYHHVDQLSYTALLSALETLTAPLKAQIESFSKGSPTDTKMIAQR